jgi:ketosteroid isomerase-like protein
MSRENVALVQRAVQDVQIFWALLDDYVVWDLGEYAAPGLLEGVYVGRDAVVEASRNWWGAWTDYRLDAEEIVDAGASVVVSVLERGRGKGSGVPYERRFAQVWTFHRGKIIRWELFADEAAALEALRSP